MIDQLVQSEFHLNAHPQIKKSYKDMAVLLSFRFQMLASVSSTDTMISSEPEYPGSFAHYPKQAPLRVIFILFCIGDEYICTDKLACFDKYILLSK